jgi:glycosyltransferase involved in cell wall biosynthesis
MLPHEDVTFIQTGRAGVWHVGRARAVVLPASGTASSVAFYVLGPLAAAVLTFGRRQAAIVCLSPFEGIGALAATRLIPERLRPRVIVELHGDWRTASSGYGTGPLRERIGPLADRAARWALRRADAVRVVSAYTEDLARQAGVSASIERYMAFTDAEPLLDAPVEDPPRARRAAFVGALEHVKGVDVLLEAWRSVRHRVPDARLVVAGDGALWELVAREAASLGIEVVGRVPLRQVTRVLDEARFLIVPSRSEGLGRVVWEAFARGRAVIGTAVGGIPESVEHGVTGLLVPPEDPTALADAIVEAFEDETATARMGAAARAAALERDPAREFEEGIARQAAWVGGR